MIATPWKVRQFGRVFERFRDECPPAAWDDLLMRYAMLRAKGPACGPLIAKKLKGGDGIWELLGHADNAQPRVFFYFSKLELRLIVVVAVWLKQGSNYTPHIKLAQKRRASIERGEKATTDVTTESRSIH